MTSFSAEKKPWFSAALVPAFLGICLLIYLLSLRAYRVGWFNDDAFFIIGARSLLQGRFVELNSPSFTPLIIYMPGYPLLLAPLVALFGDWFLPLQLLSVFFTMGSVILMWKLMEAEPFGVRIPVVVLSALNPLTVSLSGTVLSDIPYSFFTVLVFYLLRFNNSKPTPSRWALVFGLAVFCYSLRVSGAAVCLAVLIMLLLEKKWRPALGGFVGMGFLVSAFYWRNLQLTGTGSGYLFEFIDPYSSGAAWKNLGRSLLWHWSFYPKELFVRNFFRWPAEAPAILNTATVFVGFLLTGVGLIRKKYGRSAKAGLAYLVIYAAAHSVWHAQSSRYFLPVLPFVYFAFFKGADEVSKLAKCRWSFSWLFFTLALFLFVVPLKNIIKNSLYQTNPVFSLPEKTFSWIRSETKPDAIFAAELDGQVYLLTKRQVVHFRKDVPPAQFHLWTAQEKIDYLLLTPTTLFLKTQSQRTRRDPLSEEFLQEAFRSDMFEKVFESPKEMTKIYRRRADNINN